MKVLIVGGGGREHALAWKIARSPRVEEILCAPGNAGIASAARCIDIGADRVEALVDFADREGIGLTVVGPEVPLTMGIVDAFQARGLRVFGPGREAARIEGSKVFAKDLMMKYGVPTASYSTFDDAGAARRHIEEKGAPVVVKADGLAAGKGVYVCRSEDEALEAVDAIMVRKAFGDAGSRVIVEELLEGEEASFIALTDGERVVPMPSSQDHKQVFDGDRGPNTGGMGAYSPAPVVTDALRSRVMETIMIPTVRAMAAEGAPLRGVLYAGLMIDDAGPRVLEFNCRFGDPETQPILARMKSDLVPVLAAAAEGDLSGVEIEWDPRPAVCVVMASGGYPGKYDKGRPISGLNATGSLEDVVVFHAGTARSGEDVVTAGGRVLGVTALGDTVGAAIKRAYQGVEAISWEEVHYRRDIGRKALERAEEV